jgi:hypothetical protein
MPVCFGIFLPISTIVLDEIKLTPAPETARMMREINRVFHVQDRAGRMDGSSSRFRVPGRNDDLACYRTVHAGKRAAVTVTAPQNPTTGGSLPASMTFPTAPSFGKRS